MTNLLKNEYIKVFKKKGFIIIIIIMLLFSLLVNFVSKLLVDEVMNNFNDDKYIVDEYEVAKNTYDNSIKNQDAKEEFIDSKNRYDLYKLKEDFDKDSWQRAYINQDTNFEDYINTINRYELKLSDDLEEYNLAKQEYDTLYKKIKNSDWKDIVKEKKNNLEVKLNLINSAIDKIPLEQRKYKYTLDFEGTDLMYLSIKEAELIIPTLKYLSLELNKRQIEVAIEGYNMQLDKNISYSDKLYTTIDSYMNAKLELLRYEGIDLNDPKLDKEFVNSYYQTRQSLFDAEYSIKYSKTLYEADLANMLISFYDEFMLLIVIFIMMIAGPIVSSEFSKGTIKMLLVKPYSRIKILLSKYIVSLSSIFMAVAIMFIIELIVGGIFFGFDSLSIPVFSYSNISDSVTYMSVFKYFVLTTLSYLPQLIILATIVFAASSIINNTTVSIITGFVVYIGVNIIGAILSSIDKVWVKYFIGYNWNFEDYIFNNKPMISGLSFGFSLFICLLYFIPLIVLAFIVFKKKDIKNI